MTEPFIGEIRLFAGNFAPRGWAFCNGQLLPIAQNAALFSILGTTYGGDGRVNFALPNLQGRSPMHWGNGPGLSPRLLGETSGTENVTLNQNQMPTHTHPMAASTARADDDDPAGNLLAQARGDTYTAPGGAATTLAPTAVTPTGGNQPFTVMQPYLAVSFIVALVGIFPARN